MFACEHPLIGGTESLWLVGTNLLLPLVYYFIQISNWKQRHIIIQEKYQTMTIHIFDFYILSSMLTGNRSPLSTHINTSSMLCPHFQVLFTDYSLTLPLYSLHSPHISFFCSITLCLLGYLASLLRCTLSQHCSLTHMLTSPLFLLILIVLFHWDTLHKRVSPHCPIAANIYLGMVSLATLASSNSFLPHRPN